MNNFRRDIENHLQTLGDDLQHFVDQIIPVKEQCGDFRPACDILESESKYKIVMDIPGLSKNEVNVSLKDHVLTVRGERITQRDGEEVFRRQERSGGVFSRSFALPKSAHLNEIDATFRTGVLTITMPKGASADDATNIPIN